MSGDTNLISILIGLVISGLFFYTVIKAAIKSALSDKENREKSNLDYEIKIYKVLLEIAKKHDVSDDQLKKIDEAEDFLNERKELSKKANKKSWF